jgi:hypothetical protein
MALDTRRPQRPPPDFTDSNLATPRFQLTASDGAGHPAASTAASGFCRFELGYAKIRINGQRWRWTPGGLNGRLRILPIRTWLRQDSNYPPPLSLDTRRPQRPPPDFADSNLATPRFQLTASDGAGHPAASTAAAGFYRFELGYAKIRINGQRWRWTPGLSFAVWPLILCFLRAKSSARPERSILNPNNGSCGVENGASAQNRFGF